jgi:hypothetical protein
VIEIPYGHLSDRQAMRGHFYRLGRFLLGRDNAARIREDLAWFDAPRVAEPDAWDEMIGLVEPRWTTLAEALRAARVPAPADVDRDIVAADRVTGRRMILVWDEPAPFFALAERTEPDELAGDARYLLISADTPVAETVAAVQARFS